MIKEVCKQCVRNYPAISKASCLCIWTETDEERWIDYHKVFCPYREHDNTFSIHDGPPKDCVCIMEHVVFDQKDVNK